MTKSRTRLPSTSTSTPDTESRVVELRNPPHADLVAAFQSMFSGGPVQSIAGNRVTGVVEVTTGAPARRET